MTYQGRTAIATLCRLWGIERGDEVLVPAYNCGTEIDPFVWYGARAIMYHVDASGAIDLADIQSRVGSRTRLVYVTHYFGWPQDLRVLRTWCQSHGLLLVEDCALALFSAGRDGPVGFAGDAAVFSLPKTLSVPDGGALVLHAGVHDLDTRFRGPGWRPTFRQALPLVKQHLLQTADRLGMYPVAHGLLGRTSSVRERSEGRAERPEMPRHYYFNDRAAGWRPSRLTLGLLRRVRPDRVVARRRQNYAQLDSALRGVGGVVPLFDALPEGVCPLALPLLVADRHHWVTALNALGIGAIALWAGYHRAFSWSEFPEARQLKDQVLALPVHQDLSTEKVDYIATRVRELAGRAPRASRF